MSETETENNENKSGRPRLRKPIEAGPGYSPPAPDNAEAVAAEAQEEGKPVVLMVFPKEVLLTLSASQKIIFKQGVNAVPADLATHWWLKANGAQLAPVQQPA